jgi:hypothetical protein
MMQLPKCQSSFLQMPVDLDVTSIGTSVLIIGVALPKSWLHVELHMMLA